MSLMGVGLSQGQRPVFRAITNITQTDVTVLDKDGRPVHGLTMDDFELYEDGEKLELLGFAEVNIPDAADGPAWLRETTPDVHTALNGRVMVFLLDDSAEPYLMRPGAGNYVHPSERIAAVKRIAGQFINRMGPDDLAAVICVYDKRCDQDFTNDRDRLRAAVANFRPKNIDNPPMPGMPPTYMPTPYKVSGGMSESIAKMLEGHGTRRRTIIYVSRRLPARPAVWPPPAHEEMKMEDIQALATFESAMKSGITVYGVNPASLLSLKDAPADDLDAPESGRVVRFTAPPRSLSLETGGFNINRPADFAEGVSQVFRETGSYYLLGYEPPEKKDTGYNMVGGLRQLEVRVKREGLTIKAKRGYIAPPAPKASSSPLAESTSALAGILPKTDLPLRVTLSPFAVAGQLDAVVAVTLGIGEPLTEAQARDSLDVQVRAFTPHGDQVAAIRKRVDVIFARNRGGNSVTEVVSELRLKPGRYEVRASASSDRVGDSGSVYANVEIPDFSKAPLALSGIVLMSFPKLESVTPDPLSVELPFVPTTAREFARSTLVRGFMRVYQGGKTPILPMTVRTTILDESSKLVFDLSEPLPADRFGAGRSADVRLDVPTTSLQPGLHRMRVEVFGESRLEHRDIVFTVK